METLNNLTESKLNKFSSILLKKLPYWETKVLFNKDNCWYNQVKLEIPTARCGSNSIVSMDELEFIVTISKKHKMWFRYHHNDKYFLFYPAQTNY